MSMDHKVDSVQHDTSCQVTGGIQIREAALSPD